MVDACEHPAASADPGPASAPPSEVSPSIPAAKTDDGRRVSSGDSAASAATSRPGRHVRDHGRPSAVDGTEHTPTKDISESTEANPRASAPSSAAIGRAAREKQFFRFMDLPSELRLSVYRMALCQPEPILLHLHQPRPVQEGNDSSPRSRSVSSSSSDSHGGVVETNAPNLNDLWHTGNHRRNNGLSASYLPTPPPFSAANDHAPHDDSKPLGPLVPAILRVSQQIYREARPVLYSDNVFILRLDSALATLSTLHQRSRSLIKHVRIDIPTHHDILESFADLVRLGLRYCWGLKTFTIALPAMTTSENLKLMNSTTNVYANAFHILRWLPKGCRVVLEGQVCDEIKRVVEENGRLAVLLDEKDYQRRQHAMQERNQSPMSKVGPATRGFR